MAKKGSTNKQKRLSVSPIRHVQRKEFVWTVRQKPGPHTMDTSVPLGFVIRDMLKMARTLHEAKKIITHGNVLVDGHMRKSHQFAVGLFDTVSIPSLKKHYRLTLDTKGRLKVIEITEKVAQQRPVKVVHKVRVKGNAIQIQTHDGKTYTKTPENVRVGDSVLVNADGTAINEHLPFAKGSHVLITGGLHVGEVAKIASILEGTMKRSILVNLIEGESKFQTTAINVMVIDAPTGEWIKSMMKGSVFP